MTIPAKEVVVTVVKVHVSPRVPMTVRMVVKEPVLSNAAVTVRIVAATVARCGAPTRVKEPVRVPVRVFVQERA